MVHRFGATIRDGFTTPRTGPERVADHGSIDAGSRRPGQLRRAADAIARYEAFADRRPPGWPAAGAAALCALAALGRAASLEGDIARLRCLAKDMRAATLVGSPTRLDRLRRRVDRRYAPPAPGRLHFRQTDRGPDHAPRLETPEGRRRRIRDLLLRRGQDPARWPHADFAIEGLQLPDSEQLAGADRFDELDGLAARARRYHDELERGAWALPSTWEGEAPA